MDATTADSLLDWLTTPDVEVPLATPAEVEQDAAAIIEAAIIEAAIIEATTRGAGLTARQRAILDFERRWWRQPGAKEQAIRESFDLSPTRYYQALNELLALPQALSYDPALVQRLIRLRSSGPASRRRLD